MELFGFCIIARKTFDKSVGLAVKAGYRDGYEAGYEAHKDDGFARGYEAGLADRDGRLTEVPLEYGDEDHTLG